MDEAAAVQKVVVIQDASREVSWSAIRYVMTNTQLLKAGDELILIPVLHQVNNPSTLSFTTAKKKCKDLLRFFGCACMNISNFFFFLIVNCMNLLLECNMILVSPPPNTMRFWEN